MINFLLFNDWHESAQKEDSHSDGIQRYSRLPMTQRHWHRLKMFEFQAFVAQNTNLVRRHLFCLLFHYSLIVILA
jgi:hypothetical protein